MGSAADVIADMVAGRQGRQTVQDVRRAFGPGDAGRWAAEAVMLYVRGTARVLQPLLGYAVLLLAGTGM